ncbi:hypothetical protein [Methylacidimicrobium sp. AP8]|uniref:hypothetical protein n=1 Tax=Methylacidimicrobium sp. AP8 TaxID=2730359 RepID=UPI001922B716|nr:hypothetical protein [Methylacidimicrobium sp. AP8]
MVPSAWVEPFALGAVLAGGGAAVDFRGASSGKSTSGASAKKKNWTPPAHKIFAQLLASDSTGTSLARKLVLVRNGGYGRSPPEKRSSHCLGF